MKARGLIISAAALAFLAIAIAAPAQQIGPQGGPAQFTTPYPSAGDYLTSKTVSPFILDRKSLYGPLPKGKYLFPNDWVKQQDWAAIKKKYGGTHLEVLFEGTDIGAPLETKAQFEQMTGMHLTFTGVPIVVEMQKLLISFASGNAAFDVSVVTNPQLPTFIRFLEPLDSYIEKWKYNSSDYLPHFLSLMTNTPLVPGGKIYALPDDYDQHYFHVRQQYLEPLGVKSIPETWDELLPICEKLKETLPQGMYPLGFMISRDFFTWETYWDIAAPFGANYFKPGTWEPDMASPDAIKAANFIRMLITKGYLDPASTTMDYARNLEAWDSGKYVMCFQYPIQEAHNPEASKIANEDWWNGILPKGPGPDGRFAPHGTYTNVGLAMNALSKHKDAAFIYMAFLQSAEVQYISTVTGTGIDPGRYSIYENKVANAFYPNAEANVKTIPYIYNDVQIAPEPEILEIMVPALHDIFTGKGTAESILPAANEQVRAVMQKYGYLSPKPPVPPPKSFWNWDLYPQYHNIKWADGVMTGGR
jgi:multiple sugar transport system substrate-binding protein